MWYSWSVSIFLVFPCIIKDSKFRSPEHLQHSNKNPWDLSLGKSGRRKGKKGLVDLSLVILKTRKLRFKHRLKAKVTDN